MGNELDEIARECWWPHHPSRTRDIALAALDGGYEPDVTLGYEDLRAIVAVVLGRAAQVATNFPAPGDSEQIVMAKQMHADRIAAAIRSLAKEKQP